MAEEKMPTASEALPVEAKRLARLTFRRNRMS